MSPKRHKANSYGLIIFITNFPISCFSAMNSSFRKVLDSSSSDSDAYDGTGIGSKMSTCSSVSSVSRFRQRLKAIQLGMTTTATTTPSNSMGSIRSEKSQEFSVVSEADFEKEPDGLVPVRGVRQVKAERDVDDDLCRAREATEQRKSNLEAVKRHVKDSKAVGLREFEVEEKSFEQLYAEKVKSLETARQTLKGQERAVLDNLELDGNAHEEQSNKWDIERETQILQLTESFELVKTQRLSDIHEAYAKKQDKDERIEGLEDELRLRNAEVDRVVKSLHEGNAAFEKRKAALLAEKQKQKKAMEEYERRQFCESQKRKKRTILLDKTFQQAGEGMEGFYAAYISQEQSR